MLTCTVQYIETLKYRTFLGHYTKGSGVIFTSTKDHGQYVWFLLRHSLYSSDIMLFSLHITHSSPTILSYESLIRITLQLNIEFLPCPGHCIRTFKDYLTGWVYNILFIVNEVFQVNHYFLYLSSRAMCTFTRSGCYFRPGNI